MSLARYRDTRLTYRNQLHFFKLRRKYHKGKVKQQQQQKPHFLLKLHQKILRNKPDQGGERPIC